MKRLLFLCFLLPSFLAGAQTVTYDTIKVAPDDERNIYLNRPEKRRNAAVESPRKDGSYPTARQSVAFDRSKLRFGANLGLSLSKNYTNLGFGPQIGYQFNQYFMAGAGIKYYYTSARTYDYEVKNHLLGANLFGYFYPVSFIALFVQPEINYIHSRFTARTSREPLTDRGFVPSLVAGAGFRLGRSHITLNYDLLQQEKSPHPDGLYLGVSAFF